MLCFKEFWSVAHEWSDAVAIGQQCCKELTGQTLFRFDGPELC
jgi:hypothetical protein